MELHEIIEIIAVEPYRIISRWSNGEIRQNDYANELGQWRQSQNPLYRQLADWTLFQRVTLNDGVLSWPTIRVTFDLGAGERNEPLEFDPITTYEQGQPLLNMVLLDTGVGEAIQKARRQANLTQEDLARRIGSTKQYVSKVERNVVKPQADTLQRMAAALGKRVVLL